MKRIVLLMVLFLFVTECGVIEGLGYDPLKVENISMGGDFLFNHGGRLYFTPSCYYKKESGDIQCGLSALGFGTHYTRGYNLDGEQNEVLFNPRDSVSHELLSFDKLMIVKDGSEKSILSYLATTNIDKYLYYFNGEEIKRFYRKGGFVDSVEHFLIECDSLGMVDFTLKDMEGTRIRIKYDMSHFLQGVRDSVIISKEGVKFLYRQPSFQWFTMLDLNTCFINPLRNTESGDSLLYENRTSFVSKVSIDQCVSYCNSDSVYRITAIYERENDTLGWGHYLNEGVHSKIGACNSDGELRLGILPSDSRDSIIECESSKNIDDECVIDPEPDDMALPNSKRTYLRKLYKSFCKGVAIVPIEMNDNLDESCNFFYRYRED